MRTFVIFLSLTLSFCAIGQEMLSFEKRIFKSSSYDVPYQILVPKEGKTQGLPLVFFLHGSGERGSDNQMPTIHGGSLFQKNFNKYPGIYVFPQCPKDSYWSNVEIIEDSTSSNGYRFKFVVDSIPTKGMQGALDLLDYIVTRYQPDPSSSTIMGLSMGGMGTYELLWRKPHLFSKAVAICGGGHVKFVEAYNPQLDIWVVHGEEDTIVLPSESKKMVEAIKGQGLQVRYSTYPGVGHDSWNNLFEEEDLLDWLHGM